MKNLISPLIQKSNSSIRLYKELQEQCFWLTNELNFHLFFSEWYSNHKDEILLPFFYPEGPFYSKITDIQTQINSLLNKLLNEHEKNPTTFNIDSLLSILKGIIDFKKELTTRLQYHVYDQNIIKVYEPCLLKTDLSDDELNHVIGYHICNNLLQRIDSLYDIFNRSCELMKNSSIKISTNKPINITPIQLRDIFKEEYKEHINDFIQILKDVTPEVLDNQNFCTGKQNVLREFYLRLSHRDNNVVYAPGAKINELNLSFKNIGKMFEKEFTGFNSSNFVKNSSNTDFKDYVFDERIFIVKNLIKIKEMNKSEM